MASLNTWMRQVAHLEPAAAAFPALSSLPALPAGSQATPPEKYQVLLGEGLAGSGFVIGYSNVLLGIRSLHQFEGKAPGTLEPLEGKPIQLDRTKVFKQTDVQVLPVRAPRPDVQFLAYKGTFTLRAGEEMLILGPTGGVEVGVLLPTGIAANAYSSADGPRLLEIRSSKPLIAAGGSGCPIIQKLTGMVVGVLLTADDPQKAHIVGFQTLCLPLSP